MTRFLAILCLVLCAETAAAQAPAASAPAAPAAAAPLSDKERAAKYINDWGQNSLKQLTDMSVSEEVRLQRFQTIFRQSLDIQAVARFVLGQYWNIATAFERNEFLQLFEYSLMLNYRERLKRFRGHTFRVLGAVPVANGQYLVNCTFTNPVTGRILQIAWRIAETAPNRYVILDAQIEGFSVAAVLRNQYAAVIQRSGGRVEGLLYELRLGANELPQAVVR